jgi:hypothetical protein
VVGVHACARVPFPHGLPRGPLVDVGHCDHARLTGHLGGGGEAAPEARPDQPDADQAGSPVRTDS